MHNTPAFETRIIGYVRGNEDRELAQHVASCPECQSNLNIIRMLDDARQLTGAFPSLPDHLAGTLQQLMPQIRPDLVRKSTSSPTGEHARDDRTMIFADLMFDSAAMAAPAGLRGAVERTRQLVFVNDVADLDLELTPLSDAWSVTGQIGMDTVPAKLELKFISANAAFVDQDDANTVPARVTPDGFFEVVLSPGNWVAAATLDNLTIVFRDIAI